MEPSILLLLLLAAVRWVSSDVLETCEITSGAPSLGLTCEGPLPQVDEANHAFLRLVYSLTLQNCTFRVIPGRFFAPFPELRKLLIVCEGHSCVSRVQFEPNAFDSLPSLRTLAVVGGDLSAPPPGLFCPLHTLQQLGLANSAIAWPERLGFGQNATGCTGESGNWTLPITFLNLSLNKKMQRIGPGAFASLPHLQHLSMDSCGLVDIHLEAFKNLKQLKMLTLTNNNLSHIPEPALRDIPNLHSLFLSGNRLFTNLTSIIHLLPKLKQLNASFAGISSIDTSLARGQKKLPLLWLALVGNRLESIANNFHEPFDGEGDETRALEHEILNVLSSKQHFPMNPDSIRCQRPVFHKLLDKCAGPFVCRGETSNSEDFLSLFTGLRILDLGSNNLKAVPASVKRLFSLQSINLKHNRVRDLPSDTFEGLRQLSVINLGYNDIRDIGIKSGNPFGPSLNSCLLALNLEFNQIQQIVDGAFDELNTLHSLFLKGNHLTTLAGLFSANRSELSLVQLDVSGNLLETLSFDDIPSSVTNLQLIRNKIKVLRPASVLRNQIKELNLAFNQLEVIERQTLNQFPDLESLSLQGNQLATMEPCTFCQLLSLRSLLLHDNRLTSLDPQWFGPQPKSGQVRHFDLQMTLKGNPFICDCHLQSFKDTLFDYSMSMLGQNKTAPIKDVKDLKCHPIYSKKCRGKNASSVDLMSIRDALFPEDFLCKKQRSPLGCPVYHTMHGENIVVDCSSRNLISAAGLSQVATEDWQGVQRLFLDGNHLERISKRAFSNQALANLTHLFLNHSAVRFIEHRAFASLPRLKVLDLSHNDLEHLRGAAAAFEGLGQLRELDLAFNKLRTMDQASFQPLLHLRRLDLSSNRIVDFPVWNLALGLPSLVALSLGGNPWSCNCNYIQRFMAFLRNATALVQSIDALYCQEAELQKPLITYNLSECFDLEANEGDQRNLLQRNAPLLGSLAALFFLCTIVAALLFYYWKEIKVLVYIHYGIRLFQKRENLEEDGMTNNGYVLCEAR